MEFGKKEGLLALYQRKKEALQLGNSLIDLSMVNPDLPPPRLLQDRFLEAVSKSGSHRYSAARGVRKLREAVAYLYDKRFNEKVDLEQQICITNGSKDSINLVLKVLLSPGDAVLVGNPCYPAYRYAIDYVSARPVFFEVSDRIDTLLDNIKGSVERESPRVVLLNFPHNPTGATVSAKFYQELGEFLASRGVALVNDFVYGEMTYDYSSAVSALKSQSGQEGVVVEAYSFSKAYSVPGWRLGALVGHSGTVKRVAKLKSRIDFGGYLPFQFALSAAIMSGEELVPPIVERYRRRASVLSSVLERLGWRVSPIRSGCCLLARMPTGCSISAAELAFGLMGAGLAVLPGEVFGLSVDDTLRFALVADESTLREAGHRLDRFMEEKCNEPLSLKQAAT